MDAPPVGARDEHEQRGPAGGERRADAPHGRIGDPGVEHGGREPTHDADGRRRDRDSDCEADDQAERAAGDEPFAGGEAVLLPDGDRAVLAAHHDRRVLHGDAPVIGEVAERGESLLGRRRIVEREREQARVGHAGRIAAARRCRLVLSG